MIVNFSNIKKATHRVAFFMFEKYLLSNNHARCIDLSFSNNLNKV